MARTARPSGRRASGRTRRGKPKGGGSGRARRRARTSRKKAIRKKTGVRGKAAAASEAAAKITGAGGNLDQITFELRWLGGAIAKLRSLIDNQKTIAQNPQGPSPLTVPYTAAAALTHTIQWDLWAPGQEMKSLTAKAKRAGGTLQELNKADSAKDKWPAHGVLV